MAGPVGQLEGLLQSMLRLKPPGVSPSKVTEITALANNNVQSETVIIQRIYTHFKKAPPTHKLGVLYIVDSVTRGWVEQARKSGQAIGPNEKPADGTFAAGYKRVSELLPHFLNDIINTAPEGHKEKIKKLMDIWDRAGTFPPELLESFKKKLVEQIQALNSTTPPGSPAKEFIPLNENANSQPAVPQPQDTTSILQALANMAKSNAAVQPGQPAPNLASNTPNVQNPYGQNMPPSVNAPSSVPSFPPAVNAFGNPNGATQTYGNGVNNAGNAGQTMPPLGGQMHMSANVAAPAPSAMPGQEQLQQQVQIITMLQQQGVPQEQWGPVLQALMAASGVGAVPPSQTPTQMPPFGQGPGPNPNQYGARDDSARDQGGYGMRSPPGRYRRSRSRSPPGYDRRRDNSPRRRRDSPTYGPYDRQNDHPNSNRDIYRQRSPERDRNRRSNSPAGKDSGLPPPGPKLIEWDRNIPRDNIKVLSRTLFVGGVTSGEQVLRKIFEPYGVVQTCIVNVDKRHAFVKMVTRKEAVAAKEGMERYRGEDMQLRTRWGVGFGPRDCSDYSSGVSVIPIHKLTDADRKWMLTAEYGGTGGKTIEGGMVVEEPDIEIGAGVSSKAISRRMQTDKSGQHGPKSNRDGFQQNDRGRQDRRDDTRPNNQFQNKANGNDGPPPNMQFPNFNFPPIPGMPNGFQFPPNFMFPGGQPPPPGAS